MDILSEESKDANQITIADPNVELALLYRRLGFRVIPVNPINLCRVYPRKETDIKAKDLSAWFQGNRCRIGVECGHCGLEAIEFADGEAHKQWVAAMAESAPQLVDKLAVLHGDHDKVLLVYRVNGDFEVPPGAVLAWKPGEGFNGSLAPWRKIASIGTGGFVVLPATGTVDIPFISAEDRATIHAAAKALHEPMPPPPPPPPGVLFARAVCESFGCEPPTILTKSERAEEIVRLASIAATIAVDPAFARAIKALRKKVGI